MKVIRIILLAVMLCFSGFTVADETVNINTADADTLVKILKGIGPEKAAAIVEYRDSNGPFKSVDQLMQVKGIGKKTVDENRDKITVGEMMPNN